MGLMRIRGSGGRCVLGRMSRIIMCEFDDLGVEARRYAEMERVPVGAVGFDVSLIREMSEGRFFVRIDYLGEVGGGSLMVG